MIRRLIAVALTAGLVLSVRAAFDPPAEPEEPPVKLRKKPKEPVNPDKPPEKPERPPEKPKLDDDLDPREQGKEMQPNNVEPEPDEILQRIARNTRKSEEKLAEKDVSDPTRQIQDEILKDIDKLIEQSNQDNGGGQDNPQNQQGGMDQQPSGGQSGGQSASRSRQQRREQRDRQRLVQRNQGNRGSQGGQQPMQGTSNDGKTGGDTAVGSKGKELDKKYGQWGHLPEKERALMNREMDQKFMEKYDELTRQYYKTVSEKSRKRN